MQSLVFVDQVICNIRELKEYIYLIQLNKRGMAQRMSKRLQKEF